MAKAKARSRSAARKVKDKWRSKKWYNIVAPPAFDNITVADTLSDNPDNLLNRVTGVSLQDLTNDFRKSHVTLYFQISKIEDTTAHTNFVGSTLTSDYLRRMIRRRRSKIDGVYDVTTRDGGRVRVKPFATTDKRIQNSQKRVVRESMKKTIEDEGKKSTMSEFIRFILDGKLGSEIYKNCKKLYPVKRVEVYKTEVVSQPTIMIADKKPKKKAEETEEKTEETKEKKDAKKTKKDDKKETEEVKETETKDKLDEEPKEEVKEEKPAKEVKSKAKKAPAKKPVAKKTTAKKPAAKKTTAKKAPAKKPAA